LINKPRHKECLTGQGAVQKASRQQKSKTNSRKKKQEKARQQNKQPLQQLSRTKNPASHIISSCHRRTQTAAAPAETSHGNSSSSS